MRNIAIVEDEDGAAEVLCGYKAKYAVVFMDIQMPHRDGMSASVELRTLDKTVSLIFITNLIQYAQKGYEVDATAYIIKPVQYYDFALKFRKALDLYVMNEKQDFVLNTSKGICRISTDKLIYVEIVRHRLYYKTVDGVAVYRGCRRFERSARYGNACNKPSQKKSVYVRACRLVCGAG